MYKRQALFRNAITLNGSTDFFSETMFAVNIVVQKHGYIFESNVWLFLVHLVPRAIWVGKPVSEVSEIFIFERWGIDIYTQGGNVLPGVVGQYYMSQGVIGVLLGGVFFGVLCKFIDNRLNVVLNSRSVGFSECCLLYTSPSPRD